MPVDLWRQFEATAIKDLQANGGTITVCVTDRSQRNLLLTLDRMVGNDKVTRVLTDGPLVTFRLREHPPGSVLLTVERDEGAVVLQGDKPAGG